VPLVGVSAGVLVLGETITAWQWSAIVLLGAALAVVVLAPRIKA
jgi:O-acetylserine/cysteine efflux transporter